MNVKVWCDFLIIQNDHIPSTDCFYVYSLDSLEFLYSFGALGGSDEEYLAPLISRSIDNKYFSVFDQRTRNINLYDITEKSAQIIQQKKINEPTKFPFQELSFVNDSIFLYLSVDNKIISYNLNKNMIVDTVEFETGIEMSLDGKYNQTMDFFHFANFGNRIVTGHNFLDKVTINQCDDQGYFHTNFTSLTKEKPNNFSSNLYDNTYHYIYVSASAENVFAQYSGYKFKALQPFPMNIGKRHFDFQLEIYDWKLNPITVLEFDQDIIRCTIDTDRKRILTWNPLKDFDNIYIYEYEL